MPDQSSSLMGAIPQIAYDIIARVVPGVAVVFIWILVYMGPVQAIENIIKFLSSPTSGFTLGIFLFLIMIGYLLSIILFGISIITIRIWGYMFRKSIRQREIDPISQTEDEQNLNKPSTALMYDYVRTKLPEAGARLVKLRAESALANILITGLIVASIYNIISIVIHPFTDRIVTEVVLLIAIAGLWSFNGHIERRYITNLKNHWFIISVETSSSKMNRIRK